MSPVNQQRVGIVIPAFNEATILGCLIEDLKSMIDNQGFKYEIIVVDDGSKDDTHIIAKKAGAKTIRHIINTGVGGATATGLDYVRQNGFLLAATMDADGQHAPADLLNGIKLIQEQPIDLLIGSRMINGVGMSKIKRVGNKGLSIFTYTLYGVKVTDSQSGLRIFSSKALNNIKWNSSGFEFCSEMLWHAKQQGLNIGEYPIRAIYTDYSISKGQNNWNGLHIVKSLAQRRLREFIGE
jgi:glycosyltransferase involved in cell wall biosynthesis